MSKTLVLAEKPSVGRDLARVLNCTNKGNGFMEGQKYIVTWALGHLVTLADPEEYAERYKSWKLEDLPILPDEIKLVVIKQSGRQYHVVKEQMIRKDVNEIVIATDAGREGELVARWIIEKVQVRKPIKRLWISSVTDRAIQEGFQRLKEGREYENLYKSALARSQADWFVGINATRALTCKYNAQLSCGRVQSPTLSIISQREEEIKNFVPRSFYGIVASNRSVKLIWQDKQTKDIKTFDQEYCDRILKTVQKKQAVVISAEKVYKKKSAPSLYDLTELQRDANNHFGFSAKDTLSIMQSLYENHKILTYPRTDSRFLSSDLVETLKERILACSTGVYGSFASKVLKTAIHANPSFVDNNKVTDHHAIIPTEQKVVLADLTDGEKKVYDLVVKRFFAVLYPPFEYEQTTIHAKIGEEIFVTRGKVILSQGWKEVYSNDFHEEEAEDEFADQVLPKIEKGDVLSIDSVVQTTGKTKPPSRFTEATLLSAMENPTKYMDTEKKDLIKTMGETTGLGTVATRADIIEKLFNSFLIEKNGRQLTITSKGEQLLALIPAELKSPVLTATWEQKLALIAKGSLKIDTFIIEMKNYAITVVNEIKKNQEVFRHDNVSRVRCPVCGKFLLEVKGKKGTLLICQDRECGHREGISKATNARCPKCHKNLELRGSGESQVFACTCGYREKMSAFYERKKQGQGGISKKEVQSYLKDQKHSTDQPVNTALADALAKFKTQSMGSEQPKKER